MMLFRIPRLLDMRQKLFLLGVFGPVLGLLRRILPLLYPFQVSLIAPIETGIVDLLPIREGGKRRQPHINTDNLARGGQDPRLGLTREAGEPFARASAGKGDSFWCSFHRAM